MAVAPKTNEAEVEVNELGTTPFVRRPLAQKLSEIMAELHRVPKNGRNNFFGYDYVTESDLVERLRTRMAERTIAIFPSVREHTTTELTDNRNRTNYLTTVTLDITLVDGESGDQMTTTWVGQGMDSGDKGYYKAYTGAIKYFLLKTFLISTGDDPERDAQSGAKPKSRRNSYGNNNSNSSRNSSRPAPERGRRSSGRRSSGRRNSPQTAPPQPAPEVDDGDFSSDREWSERVKEFQALLDDAVDAKEAKAFYDLYIDRMGVETMEEIEPQKIAAMCRKLRAMNTEARRKYVLGVLGKEDPEEAKAKAEDSDEGEEASTDDDAQTDEESADEEEEETTPKKKSSRKKKS